jgi:DNA-directed RNA polymerase subunit M/transcription elongation factor TFIIS
MRVDLKDGRCRSCGSALEITEATEDALFVECTECGDSYEVETDAFGDGCMNYWLAMMTSREEGDDDS